jgi:hypothetical protein
MSAYRASSREAGWDDADASVEFLRRTVALRRVLIAFTLLGCLAGSLVGASLSGQNQNGSHGTANWFPVTGALGLLGASFLARRVLRARQRAWAVELAERCGLASERVLEVARLMDA